MAKLSGGDPSLLRRLNAIAVLRALYAAEELTLAELVKASEVSRPTVEEIATDLGEQGLVEEVPLSPDAPRPVGRPAKRYRFRAEAGHVAGLEIGPHKALCLVADLRGDVVGRARTDLIPEMAAADRLGIAHRVLGAAVEGRSNLRALGVGTIGVVSGGKVVRGERLPGWTGLDLPAEFGGACPVLAADDTKLATLAEHWRGVAHGVDDVVYVRAGRTVSLGLLLGGKLHAGHHGAAGEIGALREFAASGRFVELVAATVLTVDPQLVVIGGTDAPTAAPLRTELARLCLFPVRVETSTLGDDSVALGAVRLALTRVERELFSVADVA
ncbi:ROK family transcriptional regulator [Amycolatopsis regifaucium]|uniref:Transcriptional regulator n=1 Tax=Amycolatopsis regifaucium TaxID=546365 RepID=A0A154MI39_9PSEU|nr:ROK family transcriptional regulator [Amycolatopsis regifaucium]KZB84124.1 transcriptional regulator [Amycolatopsis regifaucium]OKA08613.1 transcriptional regulator [Amycolatopsis regifaucium]SFJ54332.1 IclR helix-turn-helix domain-containing protein [Amycolatopsis regifaucium]